MGKVLDQSIGENYALYHADCVEAMKSIPDNSVHYSVYSPPFASLYTYSASDRDMGNNPTDEHFADHYQFLIKEHFRTMMPGRNISVHCMNMPTSKQKDGFIGLKDFRGDIIRAFQKEGFIYHSEVVIWKDPVTAMQRTKALGLLHKQIKKNSAMSRQGIPDYLVTFRKPGENPEPVTNTNETFPVTEWQDYASPVWTIGDDGGRYLNPVWMDVNPSDTLQYRSAREFEDERHICLARDSKVLTYKDGYKPIQDIELGDLVLTHKGRWMPVIAKEKTSDCADVVSVTAAGVSGFRVTPTHKFWAKDCGQKYAHTKNVAKKTDPAWVEAKDLENAYINLKLPECEASEYTAQEWWTIGRWIADGHLATGTTGRTSLHISGGNHKLDHLMENLGDLAGTMHYPGSTCTQIRIKDPDKRLRDLASKCGDKAHLKRLPPEAFRLSDELSKSLLDGYLSGDGHFQEERQRWYVSSVSKELLLGLQFLVQRVHGVTSTLHPGRLERTAKIQGREVACKQEWIMSFQTHGYSFNFMDDGGAWKRVKSIEPDGVSETWNLRVFEDASYTAEGCIVKNCPLQLEVIRRGIRLWSNKGDIVLDPFNGIGSTGVTALEMGRKYIGIELKQSYYRQSLRNLANAEDASGNKTLLDLLE
jgi:DNA modification methylase